MSLFHKDETPADLGPGDSVGPYRLEGVLGEGGMGRVFEAISSDGERVALKLVKPEVAENEVFRKRFDRESSMAERIQHSHVVPVLDSGEHRGLPYLVQRYVAGGSLQDMLDTTGPIDVKTTVRVCLEVAGGLDALHEVGLVHRDVKPANVLLDEQKRAYLTDFGLAKVRDASVLTQAGQALGSMDYMAPEQIRGEEVSGLTDVYALGCMVYQCVTGEPPFADREGMRILWAHLQDEPPDPCASHPELPKDLGWAITRALEKEPARRPPTATAYARMVQVAAGETGAKEDASDG